MMDRLRAMRDERSWYNKKILIHLPLKCKIFSLTPRFICFVYRLNILFATLLFDVISNFEVQYLIKLNRNLHDRKIRILYPPPVPSK